MAVLTQDALSRLSHALGKRETAAEIANAINGAAAATSQDLFPIPTIIVATNVSQTIDFGALKVGDRVLHIPTVAGNSSFLTVATVGTLGAAAVVGDLYVVLRAYAAPTALAGPLPPGGINL